MLGSQENWVDKPAGVPQIGPEYPLSSASHEAATHLPHSMNLR